MTRIRLLNDGSYGDMDDVKFPVEVEATLNSTGFGFDVTTSELYRVGADKGTFDNSKVWYFSPRQLDCEVVENV